MIIKGLDVSEFQGTVDWEQVKNAGYQFAMLRAGYGTNGLDLQFKRNAAECNRIGIPIGAYWVCRTVNPEIALCEADRCLNVVSEYRLDYPICYDIEQDYTHYTNQNDIPITPETTVQLVENFCGFIKKKRYYAMFYSNRNSLHTYLSSDLSKRYDLWYAFYNSRPDHTACGIWQYTSQGSIPGIVGEVDLDYGYIDYPKIIQAAGLNHLTNNSTISSSNYITYVIQPDDTFASIASRYGITYQTLVSLNKLSNPNSLCAGQTLRIPEIL